MMAITSLLAIPDAACRAGAEVMVDRSGDTPARSAMSSTLTLRNRCELRNSLTAAPMVSRLSRLHRPSSRCSTEELYYITTNGQLFGEF